MKHNIRINGQIQTLDCEFGTNFFTKNGVEIFEGDLIKNPKYDPEDAMSTPEYVVVYDPDESAFVYCDPVLHKNNCEPFPNDPLALFDGELEIVGHISED